MKGFLRRLAEGVGGPVDRHARLHPFVESSYGSRPGPAEDPAPLLTGRVTTARGPERDADLEPLEEPRPEMEIETGTETASVLVPSSDAPEIRGERRRPALDAEDLPSLAKQVDEPASVRREPARDRRGRVRPPSESRAAPRMPPALLPVDLPPDGSAEREPIAVERAWAGEATDARAPAVAHSHTVTRPGGAAERSNDVHIHIGRIEVLAVPPAAPRPAAQTAARKGPSLDEYLRRKSSGGAR